MRADRLRKLRYFAGDDDIRDMLTGQLLEAEASLTNTKPLHQRLRDAQARVQAEQDGVQRAVERAQWSLDQANDKLTLTKEFLAAIQAEIHRESAGSSAPSLLSLPSSRLGSRRLRQPCHRCFNKRRRREVWCP